ncbi:MAG TPA: AMP-binding protein [Acidimicrobiales bacterium]
MNLAAVIEQHPADRPALVDDGHVTSYGELRRLVGELRGGMAARGVGPGDRVALVAANSAELVATYLAALGVGALAVPLDPAAPARMVAHEVDVVGARLVVVGPGGREAAAALGDGPADDGPAPQVASVEDLLGGVEPEPVERQPSDPAVLLFTSGTAGAPRPAVLTHGNLLANVEQILAAAPAAAPDDVALGAQPLFHVFGLNALLGVVLHTGGSVVLVDRFEPRAVLDLVVDRGVTVVTGAPAMWAALAEVAAGDEMANVRVALSGAAPLDPVVHRAVTDRLGVDLRQGYGLTEAAPVVTSALGTDAPADSIGRPLPGVEVRLVDADGRDVLVGDPGEIWVRGPNVFPGYWDDPEATGAALTGDGWLRTGDVAVVDDDGFLYLVDRIKDVVIVSGFNVFPAEVEAVLAAHPDVVEAAVVGEPDARTGEALHAFVVPAAAGGVGAGAVSPAAIDTDALLAHCREHLPRYKLPAAIEVVDAIPHGVAGKLLRRELRHGKAR